MSTETALRILGILNGTVKNPQASLRIPGVFYEFFYSNKNLQDFTNKSKSYIRNVKDCTINR